MFGSNGLQIEELFYINLYNANLIKLHKLIILFWVITAMVSLKSLRLLFTDYVANELCETRPC